MTIHEVPKAYIYTCDACKQEHLQKNANGHYTNSTPPDWYTIKIISNIPDIDGDTYISFLFCEKCGPPLVKWIKILLE